MSEVAAKEEVVIKVRENGPLLVTGPVRVVDHLGNKFDTAAGANIALCRCGASLKKPFCDGTHKTSGFVGNETALVPQTNDEKA
ncbi:MAG: CDGSH iron-sulfur domain-containing protein [Planctomycetota bacterium]|nr:CDGSH iron-sulfur domain-containing protein [Planctomycetales bacterium]RLS43210.1 MAG: CDGSH iron-sulfur domain-containing protein [Planctomycetota bacterium]